LVAFGWFTRHWSALFSSGLPAPPLAGQQELRGRAVQTGLIELPDGRAKIEELKERAGLTFSAR